MLLVRATKVLDCRRHPRNAASLAAQLIRCGPPNDRQGAMTPDKCFEIYVLILKGEAGGVRLRRSPSEMKDLSWNNIGPTLCNLPTVAGRIGRFPEQLKMRLFRITAIFLDYAILLLSNIKSHLKPLPLPPNTHTTVVCCFS